MLRNSIHSSAVIQPVGPNCLKVKIPQRSLIKSSTRKQHVRTGAGDVPLRRGRPRPLRRVRAAVGPGPEPPAAPLEESEKENEESGDCSGSSDERGQRHKRARTVAWFARAVRWLFVFEEPVT